MKKIAIIVAYDKNRVIGKDNDIPWYHPDDLAQFRMETKEHVVIMGRKTYESIPEQYRPLPKRHTIVLTRDKNYTVQHNDVSVFHEIDKALMFADLKSPKDLIYVAGGAEIYELFLPITTYIFATEVDETVEGGTAYFPELDEEDWEVEWVTTSFRMNKYSNGAGKLKYITYQRIRREGL